MGESRRHTNGGAADATPAAQEAADLALLQAASGQLILWYAAHRTDMPWRREPTPYHVWVSEVMLQQTRIEAVLPYYERFLTALPTVAALADATEEQLMKLWQGLGYYSRARHLHSAAVCLVENYGGELPRSAALLRTLPGIGEYTAGAIASIAYGEPEPAVDGNVMRVVARLTENREDVLRSATRARVTALLRRCYTPGEPAALLTEGWMELGERVCIPNGAPRCEQCPLASLCRARAAGTAASLPVRAASRPRAREEMTVLLLCYGDTVALHRRSGRGLLAGLYEFPHLPGRLGGDAVREHLLARGFAPEAVTPCGDAVHIFTHREWHMTGYLVRLGRPHPVLGEDVPLLYATGEQMAQHYALPAAFRYFQQQLSLSDSTDIT